MASTINSTAVGLITAADSSGNLSLLTNGNTALALVSGTVVSPTISGHPTIEGVTSTGATGTGKFVFDTSPTISGHPTIEGVTSTGATGTGKFVFDTSPTLVTPILGTPQSGNFSTGTFVWPTFNQNTTGNAATANSVSGIVGVANGGTNSNTFTSPANNISGLIFYDGTKLTNDASPSDVGYNTSTHTFSANNASFTGNITVTNYSETAYTANTSTAITLSLANGTVQILTLTGNATITMPAVAVGKSFVILLKTGAGGYSPTWATVSWPSATAPTITSASSKTDIFSFFSDGTSWFGTTIGQNY